MGEADTQLKWNCKKIKNKHNRGHHKLCGSAFSLHSHAKIKGNILLVKMSYKYCSIIAHFPKFQYTQTLRTLITQEFIKLLILSTLKEDNASLLMELDLLILFVSIYRERFDTIHQLYIIIFLLFLLSLVKTVCFFFFQTCCKILLLLWTKLLPSRWPLYLTLNTKNCSLILL